MSLTPKQRRFAKNIAAGMGKSAAAAAAGYAQENPASLAVTACRMMKHPEILRAAHAEREARLAGPMASKALASLEGVLDSPDSPAAAKVAAARWILEASGHGIESRRLEARIGDADERQPHRMSLEALEAAAGLALAHVEAEREKAAQAAALEAVIVPEDSGME
jgi:hypothetical protein